MDLIFYAFAVLLFAAVILLIEGFYLWWFGTHGDGARNISRRLRLMSGGVGSVAERISILKQRRYSKLAGLDVLLQRLPGAGAVDSLLQQAGLKWSVAQFLGVSLALPALAALLLLGSRLPAPVALLALALVLGAPLLALLQARGRRLKKLEEQLPEAADFLGRALRAGHSFSNVLQMIGSELPEPISGEFRIVHEEVNYGVPMNDALQNLAARIPLTDLRYLVIAVLIQRESGGNLAELLGNISHIIRERLKLLAQVRVLTAEGRMSAWILGLLPFCVLVVMAQGNMKYTSVLWTDPDGIRMLWYGISMIIAGALWMRALIRIRV